MRHDGKCHSGFRCAQRGRAKQPADSATAIGAEVTATSVICCGRGMPWTTCLAMLVGCGVLCQGLQRLMLKSWSIISTEAAFLATLMYESLFVWPSPRCFFLQLQKVDLSWMFKVHQNSYIHPTSSNIIQRQTSNLSTLNRTDILPLSSNLTWTLGLGVL